MAETNLPDLTIETPKEKRPWRLKENGAQHNLLRRLKAYRGKGENGANPTLAQIAPKIPNRRAVGKVGMEVASLESMISTLFSRMVENAKQFGLTPEQMERHLPTIAPSDYTPGQRGRREANAVTDLTDIFDQDE